MKEKSKPYSPDELGSITPVASATECTGLIQIPPENDDEAENYSELYDILPEEDGTKKPPQ